MRNNYRQAAQDAREHADKAENSSRGHARDLDRMVRTAEDAREKLAEGRKRQSKRDNARLR